MLEFNMTEVVAALIWDGDRFLICQRPKHKARGLLWEYVGGKDTTGSPTRPAWWGEDERRTRVFREVKAYQPE